MTRSVRQIANERGRTRDAEPKRYAEFVDCQNIILLGDPGAGKSHLFKEAATSEGAHYITARTFLNTPAHLLQGQALFVDGLDESRAGRSDRGVIDAMVRKLFEVAPPKLRISCRVADWLGDSDVAAMSPYFGRNGGFTVLHLEKLSPSEQLAVLESLGADHPAAEQFVADAAERGLGDFLENPQNLRMLWEAVKAGQWPASRKQLFELSTKLALEEFNTEKTHEGGGSFSVANLRLVAGAICAARLISDVDAISLTNREGTENVPSYRSLDLFPSEEVQAALGRRVFDADAIAETVDYSHRTIAEFLAAEFLASRVRAGLPIGRLMALMGIDGHPASELRGLHAWLAVHLHEFADELIEADPFGVLTYGDAASLARSSCVVLIRSLGRLSQANPWFRSENWHAPSIGALSRPDMVEEFRSILDDPQSGHGIRSLVVDVLMTGTPLPEMIPDLEKVLARRESMLAERLHALFALLRLGEAGKNTIRTVYASQLGNSSEDLGLRIAVLHELYGDPFGPADVVALVNDFRGRSVGSGMVWDLADVIPEQDLPAILDGITPSEPNETLSEREVSSFFAQILVRAWASSAEFNEKRALGWLKKNSAFKRNIGESQNRALHMAMQKTPQRLRSLAAEFFSGVPLDKNLFLEFSRFQEAILHVLSPEELVAAVTETFSRTNPCSVERQFLYEIGLSLSYRADPANGIGIFDDFFERAEQEETLKSIRDSLIVTILPENYLTFRARRDRESENGRDQRRQEFDQDIAAIRSGSHIGWVDYLGRIYYAKFFDLDEKLSPHDRLADFLGEQRLAAALVGLVASLTRDDLPSFDDVMKCAFDDTFPCWWYGLAAGLAECCKNDTALTDLSDGFLKAMLAFVTLNFVRSREETHPWRAWLEENRPEVVRDVYVAIARMKLTQNSQYVDGLSELLNKATLDKYIAPIVLDFLRDFPDSNPQWLSKMLEAAIKLPSIHVDFVTLATRIVEGKVAVAERQRDLWLATAYVIRPSEFEAAVSQRAIANPDFVFDLRESSGGGRLGRPGKDQPLPMLEFLARLTGSLFPHTPPPSGGWSGDRNPWDASEYCRSLINMISVSPDPAATEALQRLEGNAQLPGYRNDLLYALDSQQRRRREKEYDRPGWTSTIVALANRSPATVSDLHALLVAHLRDLANRVSRENVDVFKPFWNVDSHAKPTDPRPEEACRDYFVTLLRPSLVPFGVMVEPEAHMVADKRADISVQMPGRKILCELKRDYHAEVWTAPTGQLERFYAHDPEAKGFGVYLVFWFGPKRHPRHIPTPPNNAPPPTSAKEMEDLLRSLLNEEMSKRLAVIVVDVSGEV
ncbi:NACHT domain-containing protein [Methylocystis sp. JAN1]|uniref:NACHT domain-containing protein n=1 Tax=Methylocystis sp. JAN1 TaxID=3397211 RepID=UPI003FA2617D